MTTHDLPHAGTTPLYIIVISADPTQLKLLSMALHLEWNCEVFCYENVQQAEQGIKTLTPDLLILDAHIQEGRALQIMEQLRSQSSRSDLPVLVFNATVVSPSERVLYLTKTSVMPDFYEAIRQLLGLTS